ncbi:MAG: hypothetical protein P4L83_02485 [Nevskia sp.]|nr:hypothetical protein [Nevskia sp.]
MTSSAASDAASTQANAETNAANISSQNQAQIRSDLSGYRDLGDYAGSALVNALPWVSSPTDMSESNLSNLPGYQFELDQGLKSTQNAAAARGLGVSGAALKGAASYATGLADSNWQNYFNADQTNKTNTYNKLLGVTSLGENAAAQTGNLATANTANTINSLTSAANASAAGTVGSANAISSGLSNVGGSAMNYLMLNKLLGSSGSTTGV